MDDDRKLSRFPDRKGFESRVISFADAKIARGFRKGPSCEHISLIYSDSDRFIECQDCGNKIDGFDGFMLLVRRHERAWDVLNAKRYRFAEFARRNIRRLATRVIDKLWQGQKCPVCPHCNRGLMPEDFPDNSSFVHFKFERRKRKEAGEQ